MVSRSPRAALSPFAPIAKTHPADGSCPAEGKGSAKSQLQNQAKNNFCASGTPVTLTYQNFKSLQTACAVGSWGGRRPSPGGYVAGTGATDGGTAAGGR